MIGAAHYFGAAASLFGMLHWPRTVRGAALICPPLAYEAVCAHRALWELADQLSDRGVAVLRMDYDGTGNSLGDGSGSGRVAAWQASIAAALDELHALGSGPVVVVGVRAGALLAASVAEQRDDVAALALWDPVTSGRRYARGLRLMATASAPGHDGSGGHDASGGHDDAGVSVAGLRFDADALADLSRMRLDLDHVGTECLVISRPAAEPGGEGAGATDPAGPPGRVRTLALAGTAAMLDTSVELSRVPERIVAELGEWIAAHCVAPAYAPVAAQPNGETVETRSGRALRHRARRVAGTDLFAIETLIDGSSPQRAVLMLNNGSAPLVGPGRSWQELAPRLAETGARVMRLDLGGLGDSPTRSRSRAGDAYPESALDDISAAVTDLLGNGVERITVLGLCSGALLAFDAALASPAVDSVVSINARFDKPWHDPRPLRPRRAGGQTARLLAVPLSKTPLLKWFDRVPGVLWSMLDRLHLVALPVRALERVLDRGGVQVLLVFGPEEWGLSALRRRSGRRFAAVSRDPELRLVEEPGLDHSMFDRSARARVTRTILDHLSARVAEVSR